MPGEVLKEGGDLVNEDTCRAASEVRDLLVKTHPADVAKIAEIRRLVSDHLEVERLLELFEEPRPRRPDVRRPRRQRGRGIVCLPRLDRSRSCARASGA